MAEHNVTVESTLTALMENRKYAAVKDMLVTMNPADIASIFDELDEDKIPHSVAHAPYGLSHIHGHDNNRL